MQNQNQFFDDLARMTTGAMGTFAGMTRELEGQLREKVREWVGGEGFVTRDEFEAVRAMAANARAEVDSLKAEIAAMKGRADGPAASDAPAAGADI